jgi:ATP-dependent Lon protease
MVPRENEADVAALSRKLRSRIAIKLVENVEQIIRELFPSLAT